MIEDMRTRMLDMINNMSDIELTEFANSVSTMESFIRYKGLWYEYKNPPRYLDWDDVLEYGE